MPHVTNIAACAIERDLIYLAQAVDDLGFDAEFSRMTFYDPQNVGTPWLSHDLHWKVVSVCVWNKFPGAKRLYVALSNEGDVELIGPSKNPEIVEQIKGAGLNRPSSLQRGPMMRVRQIGSSLYACGSGYLVFRRDAGGWRQISPMESTLDSAADSKFFYDVNGADESSLYAVGPNGFSTSKIAFYDGRLWVDLVTNSPGALTTICPSTSGDVYIGGSDGVLVRGRAETGFSYVSSSRNDLYFTDIAEYQGILYTATTSGMFRLIATGAELEPVVSGLSPEITDVSRLDAVDGALWAFGAKDLAFLSGSSWTRVHDPENPRVGR